MKLSKNIRTITILFLVLSTAACNPKKKMDELIAGKQYKYWITDTRYRDPRKMDLNYFDEDGLFLIFEREADGRFHRREGGDLPYIPHWNYINDSTINIDGKFHVQVVAEDRIILTSKEDSLAKFHLRAAPDSLIPKAYQRLQVLQTSALRISDGLLEKYSGWDDSLTLPSSITVIGDYAFHYCKSLRSITLPNSIKTIGDMAFYGCSSLRSINIPNSVTIIGKSSFEGCESLRSITLPNSITAIGKGAFCKCSSLHSITIPNSITAIGDGTFLSCTSLTVITLPNSIKALGDGSFYNCSSLKSLILPNSVTTIGDYTFKNCSSLHIITLPNTITAIGDYAFQYCKSLHSITVLNSTPVAIDSDTFTGVPSSCILHVPEGSKHAYQRAKGWNRLRME